MHAIIKFNDGLIKIIAHETTMDIPIFNSIYFNEKIKSKDIDIKKLNNLELSKVDRKFPCVNILKELEINDSLYETVIVSLNDELVNLFLNKKIKYSDIYLKLSKIINTNEFKRLKKFFQVKFQTL